LFENGLINNKNENVAKLYKSDFLENEPEAEWMLSIRHRLRQKYLLHEIELGDSLGKSNVTSFSLEAVRND